MLVVSIVAFHAKSICSLYLFFSTRIRTRENENENENKSEVKRAKVVLEARGERVVVRVSESVERVLRECEEE